MLIRKGDVFYIMRDGYVGSEQSGGRPAIIVSNDRNNAYSNTVEVVFLTTQPKRNLPTHVTIRSTKTVSTALCEQITTVDKQRIDKFKCKITRSEMSSIEKAMHISLDLR